MSGVRECSPRVAASRDQLINIPDENCEPDGGSTRKPICIEPRRPRRKETGSGVANVLQIHLQRGGIEGGSVAGGNIGAKYEAIGSSAGKQKIPRPANAFMLFANEWRKKLAIQNPRESNKDISVRPVPSTIFGKKKTYTRASISYLVFFLNYCYFYLFIIQCCAD